ncbi:MAG: polymer-forming cytoskeletal protein [Bacteroidota bacterium]|jgi:cytoskeletal protein CcmA (bactofilin family)
MAIFNTNKNQTFNPQEINIINAGTSIKGDISSEGDLRIDGNITGNISVKSKLVLGASSKINGNVKATNCDVQGNVNGNLIIEDLLSVKSTAKIFGDITSQKLVIESGAEFNGNSQMGVSKTSNGTQKPSNPINVKPAVTAE